VASAAVVSAEERRLEASAAEELPSGASGESEASGASVAADQLRLAVALVAVERR
jgi:hypothetical protein